MSTLQPAHPATKPLASPAATLLRVAGLVKRFGDHDVLRGIDLDVAPGDRIAILGASGSGKSTLLRCLNFMERPSAVMCGNRLNCWNTMPTRWRTRVSSASS